MDRTQFLPLSKVFTCTSVLQVRRSCEKRQRHQQQPPSTKSQSPQQLQEHLSTQGQPTTPKITDQAAAMRPVKCRIFFWLTFFISLTTLAIMAAMTSTSIIAAWRMSRTRGMVSKTLRKFLQETFPKPKDKTRINKSNFGYRPLTCKSCFSTDFTTISDNPDLCSPSTSSTSASSSSSSPELVMMITTSLDGLERRQAIRSTWASVSRNNTGHVRHVFLLGTGSDGKVSDDIMAESARYRDMVISDFVDTYGNLTYKTMAGLRWIVKHCRDARFLMKTDQDMFVFVERILTFSLRRETELRSSVWGMCFRGSKPWRDPENKYYTSFHAYPQPVYPNFCSGTGYVSTLSLVRKIVEASPDVPFFHLEDIYLALVFRRLGNVTLLNVQGFAVMFEQCGARHVSGPFKRALASGYTIHNVTAFDIRRLWRGDCML